MLLEHTYAFLDGFSQTSDKELAFHEIPYAWMPCAYLH